MQQDAAICQLDDAQIPRGVGESTPEIEHASDYSGPRTPKRPRWTPRAEETIAHTSSRHSGPRAWRRALERSIAAGLLKGATATTVTVYEDLAERMDYSTGHVRYCLAAVVERTGLSRSAVTEHVRILREGGWLAWAEHGSLRNVMRQLGMPGYARTATVYAATIPAVFDEWAGNVLSGSGYGARVVGVTEEQRARMAAEAAERQQQRANATTQKGSSRTPSLMVVRKEGKAEVVGGFTTAKRQRKTTILGNQITRDMVATAKRLATWVRPLVGWLQRASRKQLSWALLDLAARGWGEQQILDWLRNLTSLDLKTGMAWRPTWPHRVIAAALQSEAEWQQMMTEQRAAEEQERRDAEQAVAPNAAFRAAWEAAFAPEPANDDEQDLEDQPVTDEDLWELRRTAEDNLGLVLAHIKLCGLPETIRVYGHGLAHRALNAQAREWARETEGAYA